jgi:hypothetical protein
MLGWLHAKAKYCVLKHYSRWLTMVDNKSDSRLNKWCSMHDVTVNTHPLH